MESGGTKGLGKTQGSAEKAVDPAIERVTLPGLRLIAVNEKPAAKSRGTNGLEPVGLAIWRAANRLRPR